MRNLSNPGTRSFAKAKASRLTISQRRAKGHLAFDVKSPSKRYVVRFAIENGQALADCAEENGTPCLGFARTGKCYHVTRALLFVASKT